MSEVTIDEGSRQTPWGGGVIMLALILCAVSIAIAWNAGQGVRLHCEGADCTVQRMWLGIVPISTATHLEGVRGAGLEIVCRGRCEAQLHFQAERTHIVTVSDTDRARSLVAALNTHVAEGSTGTFSTSTLHVGGAALLGLSLVVAGGALFAYAVSPRGVDGEF